jgi:hypothetical protein
MTPDRTTGAYLLSDDASEVCAEECREVCGASSCPALGTLCRGVGQAVSEAVWQHAGAPPVRQVVQSWTFVESAARLGYVASLPLAPSASRDEGEPR